MEVPPSSDGVTIETTQRPVWGFSPLPPVYTQLPDPEPGSEKGQEEGGRRKEEGGRRKEEGGRRKEIVEKK